MTDLPENDELLEPLRRPKNWLDNTTKPTFRPGTFEQSFQPFTDGTDAGTGFWFYFDNDWHKFIKTP